MRKLDTDVVPESVTMNRERLPLLVDDVYRWVYERITGRKYRPTSHLTEW